MRATPRPWDRRGPSKKLVRSPSASAPSSSNNYMLQDRSLVKIADNSGGIIGRVFKILGGSKKRYARVGEELVLSIQTAQPRKSVKKKEVHRAVVVRTTNAI